MNKTRTYIELIESIPESLYPYLLGLQPFNNELQLSKILFDFIKNIQKVQLIKQPFDFTPQLLKIGITKKNAETLLSHDAQAIKSYFAHLDPLWMIAAALPIIDAEYSLRPTSFYFQLKKDFIEQLRKHDLLTFDYPLSKELLTLLYPYLPYEKRLDLLAGQLNAFEKQSLLFQKIERTEERIIKQSNLYAALESQKELLLSIQNASWWEKLLYWLKQLFHDKKTAQPCHKIQLLQAQQLQWLTQSTLQFIQHYASIESVNLLGTTLPWAVLKKDAFLKSLLREYKPTLEVLQNHPADIRRTLDLCAILCEKSVHEQDIFIQHILIHKEDQQVCYKNYPLMLQTLNESALNFYDLLIKECVEQDVIRLDDIIITDTQYPLLAKTLKTPESLGLYLKLQFLLDNNHSFQSIELGLTDELIERMIIERSYLKLSLDHHSQRTNHFVQILGKSSSLHFDEDFQKFYDRFSIENKLLFLETYIATHQQSDIKEFDAAIESLNLDVEQWNQLCSITSLSFSMTQYLLEKVILDFKNTANEMTIIEPLLRKMYHHLITTECSPVFFNYLSRLTMIYSEAKLLLFKKTSLLPELYKSFEETTFSTNKDFLLEQIAIELSLKEKQEYSTRDKLFFALTAMKANDALDKKFLSTFVGLFLTQSQAMQQALCSWLMDFLKGMACRAPIEFLEKQPLLLQIFAGFNMEDRRADIIGLEKIARLSSIINQIETELDILCLLDQSFFSLYESDTLQQDKKILSQHITQHIKSQNLELSLLGQALLELDAISDSCVSLKSLCLNPNDCIHQLIHHEKGKILLSFLSQLKSTTLDHLLSRLKPEILIALKNEWFTYIYQLDVNMLVLGPLLLRLLDYLPKEHSSSLSRQLHDNTQKKLSFYQSPVLVERMIELSALLDIKAPRFFKPLRPILQTNIFARIEYEAMVKVQKKISDPVLVESLIAQVEILFQQKSLDEYSYSALSSQIKIPDNNKIAQYLVLFQIARKLRLIGESKAGIDLEFIITSLEYCVSQGLSLGVKRRAAKMLDELCRGRGSNSHSLREPDFESGASAYSATSACLLDSTSTQKKIQ